MNMLLLQRTGGKTMPENFLRLKQNLAEIKRLARLMGAVRVHSLRARPDSIFYFVNPDGDSPTSPADAEEFHYEFTGDAVLLIAIFPIKG
jgi:hypothetical protein